MTKLAIITNDMQVAIANKHPERKKAVNKFLPNLISFLDEARKHNIPIIHLQFILDKNEKKVYENYGSYPPLFEGTEGVAILPEIKSGSDIIIVKHKDSGFFETDLDFLLKKINVDTVVICGMQTQICVQTTAADAYFRGFNVIVCPELVGSTREEDTIASIKWMGNYCARIISQTELLTKIIGENNDKN